MSKDNKAERKLRKAVRLKYIEQSNRAYKLMETRIELQLQEYHEKNGDVYESEDTTCIDLTDKGYAQSSDSTPSEMSVKLSAKSKYINRNKEKIDNIKINRDGTDGLSKPKIDILSSQIAEDRKKCMEQHRAWFEARTKTGKQSFKEENQ